MIPSFKPGIFSSYQIRGINGGGGGAQLYTMYAISSNYFGEAGSPYGFVVREPIEMWGGASGATAIACFKGLNYRGDSSSKIFYIDINNKLFEMTGTLGNALFSQVGASAFWSQINAGNDHILAVTNGGTLYGWGSNTNGQLGDGTTTQRNSPVQIGTSTWSKVSCGNNHNLGIKIDGTLWAWGSNTNGQVGDGTTTQRNSPVQIGASAGWTAISAGHIYSLGIYSTGGSSQLFAWGNNAFNQLGDGTGSQRTSPVRIGSATDWSKVRANYAHSFGIRTNGDLYGWGYNFPYSLGDGTQTSRNSPVRIGSASDWFGFSNGHVPNSDQPTHVIKTNKKAYASGNFVVNGDRGIYDEFGPNFPGYTAHKEVTSISNIVAMDYGYKTTFFVDSTGKIKYCGYGGFLTGFTATSGISFSWNPTQKTWKYVTICSNITYGDIYDNHATFAIDENNYLWAWGDNRTKPTDNPDVGIYLGTSSSAVQTLTPVKIGTSTWSIVEAGSNHVIAIKTDGTLWSWGLNTKGQLGIGSTTDQREPVQVGSDSNWASISCGTQTSYAIKTDGTLWAWGLNTVNQLGDGTTTQRNSPVQIGSDTNWSSVSAGQIHCMALKTTGTLWGWGTNTNGRIGDGTTTTRSAPVEVYGSYANWSKVSAGSHSTYAIKTDGTLWAWGTGAGGLLGNDDPGDSYIPIQVGSDTNWVDVSAGWGYQYYSKFYYYPTTFITTFATKSNGTLWTWGRESGNGTPYTGNDTIPTPIQSSTNHSNWSIAPKSKYGYGYHRIALVPI